MVGSNRVILAVSVAVAIASAIVSACSDSEDPRVEVDRNGNVRLETDEGVSVIFIDTGTNISVVELVPYETESLVEPFLMEGASAHELFTVLAPTGMPTPELLDAPRAHRPVDGRDVPATFRTWNYDGLYSNCGQFTIDEWPGFVEAHHPGYDEYYHVSDSNLNLAHYSDASVRRYYATTCAKHTHLLNTPPDDVINYEGWRKAPGGAWTKLVDQDMPSGTRLRHWDDPGADGYQWYVYVNQVPYAPGCSFVCNPGQHHTSQMWDWN